MLGSPFCLCEVDHLVFFPSSRSYFHLGFSYHFSVSLLLMHRYGKIDVFKSFTAHFTMHEMDKQVSSYVSVKFEEQKGKNKTVRYPT